MHGIVNKPDSAHSFYAFDADGDTGLKCVCCLCSGFKSCIGAEDPHFNWLLLLLHYYLMNESLPNNQDLFIFVCVVAILIWM